MEEWKPIEPGIWKPEKEGDSITGTLVSKEPANPEKNMSAKYQVDTGQNINLVWGSAVLDDRMVVVNVGDKVRITYKGKKELDKGRTLNIYKVEVATQTSKTEIEKELDIPPPPPPKPTESITEVENI